MPRVTFQPGGRVCDVPKGASLLAAAQTFSVPIYHVCGGNAICTTCRVIVLEGRDHLSPAGEEEQYMLRAMELDEPYRLSCQARVAGDVVVVIPQGYRD
jgi:ferredoxin